MRVANRFGMKGLLGAVIVGGVLVVAGPAMALPVILNAADPCTGSAACAEATSMRYRVSGTNWDQMIASSANVSANTIVQSANLGGYSALNNQSYRFALQYTAGVGYRFTLREGEHSSTVQWTQAFNGTTQLRRFDAIELLVQAGSTMPSGVSSAYIELSNLTFSGVPATGSLADMMLTWPANGTGYATQWITAPGTDLSKVDWVLRGTVVAGFRGSPSSDIAERLKLNIKTTDAPLSEAPEPATMFLLGSGLAGIGVVQMRRRSTNQASDAQ